MRCPPYPCSVPDSFVLSAYADRAGEYAQELGTLDVVHPADYRLISTWADTCSGRILDVGCGPGHWTDLLRRRGHAVEGIEPVPEFVALARRSFPDTNFRGARAEDLQIADNGAGAILAWYSLIHTAPSHLDAALTEFSRALRPGGALLVGFFTGAALEPFDHAVATAYRWPMNELATRLESAGFAVQHTEQRHDPGTRPHGSITARIAREAL